MSSARKFVHRLVKFLIGLTSPKTAIRLRYLYVFKKLPNFENPQTLNEKINVYKFMDEIYDFALFADKVAVKDYVASKIGSDHVIPTIYAGSELPPIEERTWKMPYVIKLNHGCGWNILVRNEQERNWPVIEKKIKKWSSLTFGKDTGEVHYSKIKPLVLVEQFISGKQNSVPIDYKFYVINGKVEFVELAIDRETTPKYVYFDANWNASPFKIVDSPSQITAWETPVVEKPQHFDKMLGFAEVLSEGLPLVRVDFYNANGHIYFGEMTMTPAAGFCHFQPEEYDYIYGKKLALPKNV
jgi:hypothetical protein